MSTRKPRKRSTATKTKSVRGPADTGSEEDRDERRERIAVAAYYRWERRGCTPGCELDDWLAAEQEVER